MMIIFIITEFLRFVNGYFLKLFSFFGFSPPDFHDSRNFQEILMLFSKFALAQFLILWYTDCE